MIFRSSKWRQATVTWNLVLRYVSLFSCFRAVKARGKKIKKQRFIERGIRTRQGNQLGQFCFLELLKLSSSLYPVWLSVTLNGKIGQYAKKNLQANAKTQSKLLRRILFQHRYREKKVLHIFVPPFWNLVWHWYPFILEVAWCLIS